MFKIVQKQDGSQLVAVRVDIAKELEPYADTLMVETAFRGQITYDENRGQWLYNESTKISDEVIGFFAMAKMKTGDDITVFRSVEEMKKHARKFSKQYKEGQGIWFSHFNKMGEKTILGILYRQVLCSVGYK